jgi:signal transduction histidine kinase
MKQRVKIDYSKTDYPVIVIADSAQLEQILINLLTNAIQAMPKGGKVNIEVDETHERPSQQHHKEEKKYYVVRIQDEGVGISPNDLPHIFDPFFTTKDTGEGTGLGLSISYGIVQEHGGWINASSELGHGSTFSVYLPSEEIQ